MTIAAAAMVTDNDCGQWWSRAISDTEVDQSSRWRKFMGNGYFHAPKHGYSGKVELPPESHLQHDCILSERHQIVVRLIGSCLSTRRWHYLGWVLQQQREPNARHCIVCASAYVVHTSTFWLAQVSKSVHPCHMICPPKQRDLTWLHKTPVRAHQQSTAKVARFAAIYMNEALPKYHVTENIIYSWLTRASIRY